MARTGSSRPTDFLRIAPNNRIPAIVGDAPADGGGPLSLFESGAILLYLADKTARFIPADLRGRAEVLQRLSWQMGGLGPMAGQNNHFANAAPEKLPYAIERYVKETSRLYGVLDKRLVGRACRGRRLLDRRHGIYPWVVPHKTHDWELAAFPHLERWFCAVEAQLAVQRAYALAKEINLPKQLSREEEEAQRNLLYGQDASSVRR